MSLCSAGLFVIYLFVRPKDYAAVPALTEFGRPQPPGIDGRDVGRKKRNATAITVLNLLTGFTVVGWIIALVWACTLDQTNRT